MGNPEPVKVEPVHIEEEPIVVPEPESVRVEEPAAVVEEPVVVADPEPVPEEEPVAAAVPEEEPTAASEDDVDEDEAMRLLEEQLRLSGQAQTRQCAALR